jgi:hypothetical protein
MRVLAALSLVIVGYFGLMLVLSRQQPDITLVRNYDALAHHADKIWDHIPLPLAGNMNFRSQAHQARAGEADRLHPVTLKKHGEALLRERRGD